MALENILAAIREEAETELNRVNAEAAAAAAAIVDDARAEAALAEEHAGASLDEEAAQQRSQIVNRAHLVVERRTRATAEEIYLEMRDEVVRRLGRMRDSPEYPELFARLFEECRSILPEARVIRVDPTDEAVAGQLLRHGNGSSFDVETSLVSNGGLEMVSADRRRHVRNTFEARMNRADGTLRSLASSLVPALHGDT